MSKLTLITGLFDLQRREASGRRGIEEYFRCGEFTLGLDQDIIFFCDPELAGRISNERRQRERSQRTHIVPIILENLSTAKYLEPIKQGRPASNLNIVKDTPGYTLVGWSKFELVERAAVLNPFGASHLGWIDFGIAHVTKLDDRASIEPFANPPENVRMHMLRYFDETDVRSYDYWDYRRGHLAGGFFLGGIQGMLALSASFWTMAETALANKYSPTEDCIMPVIAAQQPGCFSFSYGDYEDVFRNHIRVRGGGQHLLFQMKDARGRHAWHHNIAIGREVVASHSEGTFECHEGILEDLIMEYYTAAYYGSTKDEARKVALYYARQAETNPAFRATYLAHRDLVAGNFSFMEPPVLLPET